MSVPRSVSFLLAMLCCARGAAAVPCPRATPLFRARRVPLRVAGRRGGSATRTIGALGAVGRWVAQHRRARL
jgi:hypothetical protein